MLCRPYRIRHTRTVWVHSHRFVRCAFASNVVRVDSCQQNICRKCCNDFYFSVQSHLFPSIASSLPRSNSLREHHSVHQLWFHHSTISVVASFQFDVALHQRAKSSIGMRESHIASPNKWYKYTLKAGHFHQSGEKKRSKICPCRIIFNDAKEWFTEISGTHIRIASHICTLSLSLTSSYLGWCHSTHSMNPNIDFRSVRSVRHVRQFKRIVHSLAILKLNTLFIQTTWINTIRYWPRNFERRKKKQFYWLNNNTWDTDINT